MFSIQDKIQIWAQNSNNSFQRFIFYSIKYILAAFKVSFDACRWRRFLVASESRSSDAVAVFHYRQHRSRSVLRHFNSFSFAPIFLALVSLFMSSFGSVSLSARTRQHVDAVSRPIARSVPKQHLKSSPLPNLRGDYLLNCTTLKAK